MSQPYPPVISLTILTTSSSNGLKTRSAPNSFASFSRSGLTSSTTSFFGLRSRAGQHDETAPADLRSFDAPGRASVWLNQYSFLDRQILRYVVVNSFFGIPHVLSKTAVYVVLKSVNIVLLTHPIFTPLTESTLPTGNDLFRDKAVANLHVSSLGHILPQLNHVTEKFVARNHWRFDIRRLTVAAPERFCAHIRFNITGADAAGLNFDNNIIGTGTRYRYFFQPVITRRVGYYCPHGFR